MLSYTKAPPVSQSGGLKPVKEAHSFTWTDWLTGVPLSVVFVAWVSSVGRSPRSFVRR